MNRARDDYEKAVEEIELDAAKIPVFLISRS